MVAIKSLREVNLRYKKQQLRICVCSNNSCNICLISEPSIPEIVLPTSPVKIDFIQEDNAYSSFAKPTNYGPRILTKPEVKEPAGKSFTVLET